MLFASITTIVLAELQNPINTNPLLSGWRSYTHAVLHTTLCYRTMVSNIPLVHTLIFVSNKNCHFLAKFCDVTTEDSYTVISSDIY